MPNLDSVLSAQIEQHLSPGVRDSLPKLDALFSQIESTWMGVSREEAGRDWKFIHTFITALSGAYNYVTIGGDTVDNTTFNQSAIVGNLRSYPGIDKSVLPGYTQRTITLTHAMGNLFIPNQYLRAERLTAAILKAVADIVKGTAKNVAQTDIAYFYSTDSTNKSICEVRNASLGGSGVSVTFTPARSATALDSARMFSNGMHFDVYDSTGATLRNATCEVVCDGVTYAAANPTVTLKTKDGSTGLSGVVNGDIVVLRGSKGLGPSGPASWIKTTGAVYGIDVSVYQQFMSIIAAIDGVLLENTLSQYAARFRRAYGMDLMPDTILTTPGAENAYAEDADGLARFMRQGQRLRLKAGYENEGFAYNGRDVQWHTSEFMPAGRLWWLKLREGNIKRYTAPPLPGAATNSQFPREVEFSRPAGGPGGIFKPYHTTDGQTSEWQEAPFDRFQEFAPDVVQSIEMTGLTEIH